MSSFLDTLQNNRKYLLFGLLGFLALIIGLFFLLPSQDQPESKIPLSGDSLKTEIIWWRPFHTQQTYDELIKEFNKTYPNTEITVVNKPYGSEYYSGVLADIARGVGPDIFLLDDNDLPAYRDFVHPISLFQGNVLSDYQDNFADLVVKHTTERDSVYGVATELENLQLYYNKDLLAQNGIALPPDSWEKIAGQVDTLRQFDSQFNPTQSALSFGHGGTRANRDIGNIEQFDDIIPLMLLQAGDPIFDTQGQQPVLGSNTETSYLGLNTYLQFANPKSNAYTWSASARSNIEVFAEGKLAYMVNYSYTAQQIREKNSRLNFSVAPIPQLNQNNKKTFGTFFMNVVNRKLATEAEKNGVNSEAARKLKIVENFMYFLSLPENQEKIAKKTNAPSAHRQVLAKQQQESGDIRIFAQGALYADSYYQPCVNKTEKLWGDLFYNVHYQTGSYQSGSAKASENLDDRQIALQNAFQETRKNYQSIVQAGSCLR